MTTAVLVLVPLLFAIDGLVHRLGILYSPGPSFFAGPDLVLQVSGMRLRERWGGWKRNPFTSGSEQHVSVWEKRPVNA